MYGENDWMDVKGGYAAVEKLEAEQQKALRDSGSKEDGGTAKVYIIKKAGHHVYLDNPEEFNDVMVKELEDVRKRAS